ncbi:hypothetical protein EV426DRAFT_373891 [Tirmania nivea]|nr:hypothetical protein EV426DRAFT_373891 [Tirmania nivea]
MHNLAISSFWTYVGWFFSILILLGLLYLLHPLTLTIPTLTIPCASCYSIDLITRVYLLLISQLNYLAARIVCVAQ